MKITNTNRSLMGFAAQGFGFRILTTRVSRCVRFKGINPVQDILVFAEANGTEKTPKASSLYFTGTTSHFEIDTIESNTR
jgi:hypothetical protein